MPSLGLAVGIRPPNTRRRGLLGADDLPRPRLARYFDFTLLDASQIDLLGVVSEFLGWG